MADRALRAPKGRRDPYWGMEGKHVRRGRRTRMVVELIAFAVGLAALWSAVFIHLYG